MNAYENNKGADVRSTVTDDADEVTPPPTSKYTNYHTNHDDYIIESLTRYQLSLTKNAWALTMLTIITPPQTVLIHIDTLRNADERCLLNPYDHL